MLVVSSLIYCTTAYYASSPLESPEHLQLIENPSLNPLVSPISARPAIAPTSSIVVLELLRRPILIRVVLIRTLSALVMLIVHVLGALLGVVLGAHGVVFVHALGLSELVDFGAGETGEELFSELVGDRFAWRGRSVSCTRRW